MLREDIWARLRPAGGQLAMSRGLSFRDVDGLGFVAANDGDATQLPAAYAAGSLGPLFELLHLVAGGRLPKHPHGGNWLAANGATPMVKALHDGQGWWLSPDSRRMGFLRARRVGPDADSRLTSFLLNAHTAARAVAGLPVHAARHLAAAMEELENNIHEHSEASDTGIIAFRATSGIFEFVAADRGIGVLQSLRRCPAYNHIADHGTALRAALETGTSRFGPNSGHGNGFRPIFLGLANLNGALRFRSGDHALTIDGSSPQLTTSQLQQKPQLDGFFVSVRCSTHPGN